MKRKADQVEEEADEGIRMFASSATTRAPEGRPSSTTSDVREGEQPDIDTEELADGTESEGEQDTGSDDEEDHASDGEDPELHMSEGGSDAEENGYAKAAPAAKRTKLDKKGALEANKQKGVLYMSRVPPHMKPLKLRHMLSKHGEVGRLYLAPEDPSLRKKRKKFKGNTGKNFSEGWVEFNDKAVAKRIAAMLNGNPMGGKRRSAYHYDIWCLKYLSKFKWDHLTEEIAYQNAVREQKMANEISAAKRERDFYMSRVDRAKAEEAKEKRRKKKGELEGAADESGTQSKEQAAAKPDKAATGGPRVMRTYGQRKSKPEPGEAGATGLSAALLSIIAGKKD